MGAGIILKYCGWYDVYNNTITNAALYNDGSVVVGWPAGFNSTRSGNSSARRSRIYNNYVSDVWGEGIGVFKNSKYVDVYNNVVQYAKIGIYVGASQHIRVYGNFMIWPDDWTTGSTRYWAKSSANKQPGFGIGLRTEGQAITNANCDPVEDVLVENNLCVGWRENIFVANTSTLPIGPNIVIRNNTLVNPTLANITLVKQQTQTDVYNNCLIGGAGTTHITSSASGAITIRNNAKSGAAATGVTGTGDVSGNPQLFNSGVAINEDILTVANAES